jgi:hypothetical protein
MCRSQLETLAPPPYPRDCESWNIRQGYDKVPYLHFLPINLYYHIVSPIAVGSYLI